MKCWPQRMRAGVAALQVLQMVVFTAGFNMSGLPAISLPTHMAPSGLPVGVQLVAGPWGEAQLFRVAAQLEEALPWGAAGRPFSRSGPRQPRPPKDRATFRA